MSKERLDANYCHDCQGVHVAVTGTDGARAEVTVPWINFMAFMASMLHDRAAEELHEIEEERDAAGGEQ